MPKMQRHLKETLSLQDESGNSNTVYHYEVYSVHPNDTLSLDPYLLTFEEHAFETSDGRKVVQEGYSQYFLDFKGGSPLHPVPTTP